MTVQQKQSHDIPQMPNDDVFNNIMSPDNTGIPFEDEDDTPEDIKALLEAEGLDKKKYTCMLKEVITGQDDGESELYLQGFSRAYPTVSYLTKRYGSGKYKLVFFWNGKNETGKVVKKSDSHYIFISPKVQSVHEEWKRAEKLRKIKEYNDKNSTCQLIT